MNERIRELMLMAFQEHYGDPITPVAREKAAELVSGWGEKFAELIVRECANAIITDSRLNDVRSAANGCVRTIKEHFEVDN
jgi:hypothetical protein